MARARSGLVPRVSSFPSQQPRPTTGPSAPAPRPPIRWWLVGPLGVAMLVVLVRWISSGGLRHVASDRHGHRDAHAALESLEQACLLTVADGARVVALALLAGLFLAVALTSVRLVGRRRWRYRRYAIAPYRTDDATPEQVLALFQDWHQQIHQRLHRRLLFGQPYLALEEHAQPSDGGPEMAMSLVCPEQFVAALDGRLAATYPNSRIGHGFTRRFEPLELDISWRHAIVRLRKRRGFTATVKTDTREFDQPVIESELAAMAACGYPMTVQKVLTPNLPRVRARGALALRPPRATRRAPRRRQPARRRLAARPSRDERRAGRAKPAALLVRGARRLAQPRRLPHGGGRDRRPPPGEHVAPAQHHLHPHPAPPPRHARPARGDPLMAQRGHLGRRGRDALAAPLAADRAHPPRAPHHPARARAA